MDSEGIVISVDHNVARTPEQMLSLLDARNDCSVGLTFDEGRMSLNGVHYDFYAELRTNCSNGGASRWLIALRAANHSVELVLHDPDGTREGDFYAIVDSLRVDVTRLPMASVQVDAGAQ